MHCSQTNLYPIIPQLPDQGEYAERMTQACTKLVDLIQSKTSLTDIIKKIGILRQTIAKEMKDPCADNFGRQRKERTDRIATDLIGPYAKMVEEVGELKKEDPTICWEYYGPHYRIGSRLASEISLTRYVYCSTPNKSTISHTYPENISLAMRKLDKIYTHLLRDSQKVEKEKISKSIAKIHWWFVNITPFLRGSAAGGELLANALHKRFFNTYIYWNEGVFSDRIALVTSLTDFVKRYPTLQVIQPTA